jgi:hypothetical protein
MPENFDKDFFITFYEITQSEITRYRDREWLVPGIFITGLFTLITFMIGNTHAVKNFPFLLSLLLFGLASGNCYFLFFTHKKLTKQRNIQKNLELLFKEKGLFKKKIFPYKIIKTKIPKKEFSNLNWSKGILSHIIVFISTGFILYFFGISVIIFDFLH